MIVKKHKPVTVSQGFYQLGTPSFPAYLSVGDTAMIIEGGTGATFSIIVDQIKELGINPEQIQYLALTHTHTDHIGAVPHLKRLWPHLKIIGSHTAGKTLKKLSENNGILEEFLSSDASITRIMLSKGEISEAPPELENYTFTLDKALAEGDSLDLGSGVVWTVYNTPGHSPCHISLSNERDGILVVGDATGFCITEHLMFWPNYFESLENYCNSIRKLANLQARIFALSHNGVVDGVISNYLQKAMHATESYHLEMLDRLNRGEDPEKIALEKANWVNSITDIQPFSVMLSLAKLLITRSKTEAVKDNLFTIFQ